jgi:hypothetical protein
VAPLRITRRAQDAVLRSHGEAFRLGHDRAGTGYTNWTSSSPAFGMVRTHQHTFVPAPPPGTEVLELRFLPPSAGPGEGRPLVVSTVVL